MTGLDPRRMAIDAAIEDCRAKPIEDVADALQLDMQEASGWLSGPCPECGGEDRFNINLDDGGFFCRKGCSAKGSGPIDLVMVVQRLEFLKAVEWLHGDLPEKVSEDELKRRREKTEKTKREREAKKARYREFAVKDARAIWVRARDHDSARLRSYLALRGFTEERLPRIPAVLRYLPDHPYVVKRKVDGKQQLVTMHRGPAMIAAIQRPDGRLSCVHQTWFDVDQPMGKPVIDWDGKRQTNKLTRGSQSRGAIRLVEPPEFDTLVMAEGNETTLSAAVSWPDVLGPRVAYWSGISLGHMAGKMQKIEGTRYSGIPDMSDPDGFVPPPWIKRFICIQDGDSEPVSTRARLESCVRRAMAYNPGLRGQIVQAGPGVDLNDVLRGAA